MTEITPFTPKGLVQASARHSPYHGGDTLHCMWDDDVWPCDAARAFVTASPRCQCGELKVCPVCTAASGPREEYAKAAYQKAWYEWKKTQS